MPLIKPHSIDDLERCHVDNGITVHDEWRWEGNLHSVNDHPSTISRNYTTWHRHGVRHRDEHLGPAESWKNDRDYTYWNAGLIHRARGPAVKFANGAIEWHWYGDGDDYGLCMDEWADRAKIDPELFVMLKLQYG